MQLRDTGRYFGISALIFTVSIIAGYIYAALYPQNIGDPFTGWGPIIEWLQNATSIEIFLLIFINNSVKSVLILVLGIGFGVIPALFIAYNGVFIGLAVYFMKESTGWTAVLIGLLPHGVIEIPAILLAAGVGMRLGDVLAQTIFRGARFDIKSEFVGAIRIFSWIIMPMLLIAALIETFFTAAVIGGFT